MCRRPYPKFEYDIAIPLTPASHVSTVSEDPKKSNKVFDRPPTLQLNVLFCPLHVRHHKKDSRAGLLTYQFTDQHGISIKLALRSKIISPFKDLLNDPFSKLNKASSIRCESSENAPFSSYEKSLVTCPIT